jgi:RHS repeat-associated protein
MLTSYRHADHLSVRFSTDGTSGSGTFGQVVGTQGHLPFGETWYSTVLVSKYQFTTYERDAESTNDYAMARYHVNRLGRFSSPDPLDGSIGSPQSLNHYKYAGNDPINYVDPTGRSDFYIYSNDWTCDVHITNVNPICGDTDCAGEPGCGADGNAGKGTSGGGGGGGPLGSNTLDCSEKALANCNVDYGTLPQSIIDAEIDASKRNGTYPFLPGQSPANPLDTNPFGTQFGKSYNNWAQPFTSQQVPGTSLFLQGSSVSAGPVKATTQTYTCTMETNGTGNYMCMTRGGMKTEIFIQLSDLQTACPGTTFPMVITVNGLTAKDLPNVTSCQM